MSEFSHFDVELSALTHSPEDMMRLADRLKTVAQGLALEGFETVLRIEPLPAHDHDDEDVPETS